MTYHSEPERSLPDSLERCSRATTCRWLLLVASAFGCAHPRVAEHAVVRAVARTQPQEFSPGVVSNGRTFSTAFSHGGERVYTVERTVTGDGGRQRLVIVESRRKPGGEWSVPKPAEFSGQWNDIDPFVTVDGTRLYWNSVRPADGRDSLRSDFDIWYVDRRGDEWGAPRRLPTGINTMASEYFASVSQFGALYFTSSVSVPERKTALLRANPSGDGSFETPDTVAMSDRGAINASNSLIAPDESWLIYAADRPAGHGDSDLYIARREGAAWGASRNLGVGINTADAEFAPALSPDGRTLYFTRGRRGSARAFVDERVYHVPLLEVVRVIR